MVAMYIYAAVVVIFAPLLMLVVRAILDCVRRQTSTGMQVPLLAGESIEHRVTAATR
ncbi:unnamed protein product, partial [Globisporangium polare]